MRFLSNLIASTIGALLAIAILLFFGLVFLFALASTADQTPRVRAGSVLVAEFSGGVPEIQADDPFANVFGAGGTFDLKDFRESLRKAAVDDRIDALWIQMKGISASWATLGEIRRSILEFKKSGKPVLASSDDYYMDEAAYFIASAADSVFAGPQALFEFNGFYIAAEFYQHLLEKLDIEPQVVRAGRYKSAVEPYIREDLSPENEEQLTSLLQSWNNVFNQQVAESRGMEPSEVQRIAETEAIFSAEDGYKAGLLDGLLYRDQVLDIWKQRLGRDEDEDVEQISLKAYRRVPASEAGIRRGNEGEVAVVYAVGTLVSGESRTNRVPIFGGEQVGAETFMEAMRYARESDKIKAVVVRVNSPGGSAPASDAMRREIALTAEKKPVVVSMGDYAASGGYMISAPADTIVTDPLTITGSIGVFSIFFDVGGFFENKLGITFDAVKTSPHSDMLSALRPLTPQEAAILERSTGQIYEAFLNQVAETRNMDVARVDSLGQGRVWTGEQAVENGLADVLGGLHDAVTIAAEMAGLEEGTYSTRILPRPKTFIETLSESLNTRLSALWLRLNTSPTERMILEQLDVLRPLTEEYGAVQARLPIKIHVR